MKASTITFHTAKNYGAVLQCYALQQALRKYVDEVETIDFSTEKMRYAILPHGNGLKGFAKKILALKNYNETKTKYQKFDDFVRQYIKLSRHYSSIDELKKNPPPSSIVITGSDQVFNPNRGEDERKAYYLDFPCHYRASYAASFGNSVFPEDKMKEIETYLKNFDAISVREDYAADMISRLNEKIRVRQNIDPVFLVRKEQWMDIEKEYPGLPEKYILCFPLRESKAVFRLTEKLAREIGLPVVMITDKPYLPIKCKYVVRDAGPQNFLWLVRNCTYFVEDSFHATAFSIIFGKQFIFADDHQKSYERGRTLLNMVGLSQAYDFENCFEEVQVPYIYSNVYERLQCRVKDSEDYLREITNKCGSA